VDSSGLKAGDQVSMSVQMDGTILLDTSMERRKETLRKEIWIDADESAEHLTRKLIGAYLVGYNVIEVRSKDRMEPEAKSAIREFSRLAIGPEVVEETATSVIMPDLSDPVELPQEKCVRRMHLIVRSMHADAIEALCEEDRGLAEDVIYRDTDVDRLYWMAVKQNNLIARDRKLGDRMGLDIFGSNDLMLVARGIERIGDHAVRIARNALISAEDEDKLPNAAEIRKLSAEAMKVLEKGMDALFRKDIWKLTRSSTMEGRRQALREARSRDEGQGQPRGHHHQHGHGFDHPFHDVRVDIAEIAKTGPCVNDGGTISLFQ
jgi:phosphate uptake regulator